MGITIKTPKQCAQEYLENLKALRPEVNIDQQDSDWWIRAQVVGGVVAGVYADLNRVSNDAFPQSARREAIDKHLQVWFGSGLRPATNSLGSIAVTGAVSGVVLANAQFIHESTGKLFVATESVTLTSTTGEIPIQSVGTGQDQNLLENTSLLFSSPPVGFLPTAVVLYPGIAGGRDPESTSEGANRVLARIRNPSRGGTEIDYQNWALAADVRVTSAYVNRYAYGLGTVQIILSAGTTNIDDAIDNDEAIVVQPSADLKEIVRTYVEGYNPITDVAYVDGPTEVAINVTVKVAFASGTAATIISGTTITQGQAVTREVKRAIYKTPVGGRVINGVRAMRAADIEEMIDYNLGSQSIALGLKYQIVADRQVTLAGGSPNVSLSVGQVAIPGTITVEAI